MDAIEAGEVLAAVLEELKQQTYRELQAFLHNPVCIERQGPSGVAYQIEYQAVWDFPGGADLRLIASIDDGGLLSALMPLTSGFLITPAGEIID
ncbi:MAG: hypothetical protein FJ128_10355 [Deltaproteobacteria bacterium]|nr:hypothetical protein [Deltaproteobacteria bacterium]